MKTKNMQHAMRNLVIGGAGLVMAGSSAVTAYAADETTIPQEEMNPIVEENVVDPDVDSETDGATVAEAYEQAKINKEEAEKNYNQAEGEYNQAEKEYQQAVEIVDAADRVIDAQETLAEKTDAVTEQEQKLQDTKTENGNVTDEDVSNGEADVQAKENALAEAKKEAETASQAVLDAQAAVTEAEKEKTASGEALAKAEQAVSEAQTAVNQASSVVATAEQALENAKKSADSPEYREAEKAYQDALADENAAEENLQTQKNLLTEKQTAYENAANAYEKAEQEMAAASDAVTKAQDKLADLSKVQDAKEQAMNDAKDEAEAAAEAVTDAEDEADAVERAVTEAQKVIDQKDDAYADALGQVTEKQEALDQAKDELDQAKKEQEDEGKGFFGYLESTLSEDGKLLEKKTGTSLDSALATNAGKGYPDDSSYGKKDGFTAADEDKRYDDELTAYEWNNINRALDKIDQYNQIRKEEGLHESYVSLGTMIAATANANGSVIVQGHTSNYPLNENMAINSSLDDAFRYWYEDEKLLAETGKSKYGSTSTGHYYNIIGKDNVFTGYGIHQTMMNEVVPVAYKNGKPVYGLSSEGKDTSVQDFKLSVSVNGVRYDFAYVDSLSAAERQKLGIYTTEEFRQLITQYTSKVTDAEAKVKAAEKELAAAEKNAATAKDVLDAAKEAKEAAQKDALEKAAAVTAAKEAFAKAEQAEQDANQAYLDACQDVITQQGVVNTAETTVQTKQQELQKADRLVDETGTVYEEQNKTVEEAGLALESAVQNTAEKKTIRDSFAREVAECEAELSAAQKILDAKNAILAEKESARDEAVSLDEARADMLADKKSALDSAVAFMTEKNDTVTEAQVALEESRSQLDSLKKKCAAIRKEEKALEEATAQKTEAEKALATAKSNLESARNNLQTVMDELTKADVLAKEQAVADAKAVRDQASDAYVQALADYALAKDRYEKEEEAKKEDISAEQENPNVTDDKAEAGNQVTQDKQNTATDPAAVIPGTVLTAVIPEKILSSGYVATGDTANPGAYAALFLLAMSGCAGAFVVRKRQK